jgi:hypothetical protein
MTMKHLMAFCLLFILSVQAYSQARSEGKEACLQAMKEMVNHYRESQYLSFDIVYRYSGQQTPDVYQDSLKGYYRLNGNDYWYSLDSTEVASYQGTSVLLFKEDRIMYLTPGSEQKKNVNFLAALDSLLSHLDGMEAVLSEGAGGKKIVLSFSDKSPCKSIEYMLDRNSGYLTRIRQVIKSDQLYDPSVRNRMEGNVPYAIVDMDFSNYRSGAFDDRQLNTAQYFKKEGQQYVSVAPYEEYKIFLGAPNL